MIYKGEILFLLNTSIVILESFTEEPFKNTKYCIYLVPGSSENFCYIY